MTTTPHPDSIRLLLRCGWHEVCGLWCHERHDGAYSVDEALKLCRRETKQE